MRGRIDRRHDTNRRPQRDDDRRARASGTLDGTTQVTRLTPSAPSFVVEAAPEPPGGCPHYLALGVEHILLGIDHLLFVLALFILVKGTGRLIATVSAFTVAHSLTLAGATLGFVHVPGPPVEAGIA